MLNLINSARQTAWWAGLHVIGTNSISTIQFQDNDAATQILSELQNVAPRYVHAAIMDRTGNFALYSKPGADGLTIPDGLKVNKYLFYR